MAFKLSRQDVAEYARLRADLTDTESAVNAAFDTLVEFLRAAPAALNSAIADRNRIAAEASAFVERIADDWEGDYGEKGEKWQEGETGSAVRDLIDEWQGLSIDQMEEIEIVEPEISGDAAAESFAALPTEPNV